MVRSKTTRRGAVAPRLAVDIGGTFTDVALGDGKSLTTAKTLTTPGNPVDGVLDGVRIVCEKAAVVPASVSAVIHGTTLATNALIERKGANVGFVTTEGFRDIIDIAYERRYDQYDILLDKPDLLVTRERCWTVPERVNARGEVLAPLNTRGVDKMLAEMDAQGIESIAICLLHSYLNPDHECALRDTIAKRRPNLSITLSSEVCPEIREFDRACTALANAYIKPLMGRYLHALAAALEASQFQCPLFIVTSGGGVTTLETAAEFPIRLVESGPSGGAILAAQIAERCGIESAVSFDMGGTTAKLCLIDDGVPQRSRQFEIGRAERFVKGSGLPVRIPVVEMIEIGAGGGSIARVDSLGRLAIGPDSAGADPGPVCYGQGGTEPTVTDSDVALGFIDPAYFAERRVKLRPSASARAIKQSIGNELGVSQRDAAYGVSQMVDENMANAARVHAVEHGTEISNRTLIAFGGNGPLHASRVAEKTAIKHIIVPPDPGVGSAVGFLSAPISYELIRSLYMLLSQFDESAVRRLLDEMAEEAGAIVRQGSPDAELTEQRTVFMRYEGQGHEIEVDVPEGPLPKDFGNWLRERFDETYRGIFGRTVPNVDIEIMNWGYIAATATGKPKRVRNTRTSRRPRPVSRRRVYWGQSRKQLDVPCFERAQLRTGDRIKGPALIIESQTTTLVSPEFDASIDRIGNIIMTKRGA